jgi:hypothetical protein
VCQHNDLGAGGGGHWDCGPSFPIDYVLDLARGGSGGGAQPTTDKEGDMLASAIAANDSFHVFRAKGKVVSYTWQKAKSTSWAGGEPGEGVADWNKLGETPANIIGLTADVADNGTMHVFAECDNGMTYYTYQKANDSAWAGGKAGAAVAGFSPFAK